MAKKHNETIVLVGAGVVMIGVLGLLFMLMSGTSHKDDMSGPPTVPEPIPVNEAGLYAGPPSVSEPAPVDPEQEKATRPPTR
ncbi:MAG: hypothetical protein KBD50_03655 [Candidatus Pacebacteria bacterium]|nr:hypothetical protein [Candidatus Paceibacterota bacterium]